MAALDDFHGILTTSPRMEVVFERIRRVARTDTSVLVRGETGTGKELVARAIHALSPRADGPFKAINCATLTPELLASELFGHVRGAYTGAIRDRDGLFSLADGGTVFLDEIAEVPPDVQARLLRVLQEHRFVPVGGSEARQVNVRVLSATNKALRTEVARRRFREDLMYRLRVVPLFLPPLRARDGDVLALADRFVQRFNARGLRQVERITPEVTALLVAYPWPGNVRELRNVVEFAFAIGDGPDFTPDELPPELHGIPPADDGADGPTLRSTERDRILTALRETGGRKALAAERLGVSRSTLWRRIRELGL